MATGLFSSGSNPWSLYMLDVYRQGRGPQPLGTVVFEEIEAKAREKLKDYGGQCCYHPNVFSIIYKV